MDIDRTVMKWDGDRFVLRNPYYRGEHYERIAYPWHYVVFSQFRLYRWLVGGVWATADKVNKCCWVRMQDYEKQEFCDDHAEMEPCFHCALITGGRYGQ